MKRLAVGVLTLALLAISAPAFAAPEIGGPCDPGRCPSRPPVPVTRLPYTVPLCVTTTWRAERTHQPKTRVGEYCVATKGMWISPRQYRHAAGAVVYRYA